MKRIHLLYLALTLSAPAQLAIEWSTINGGGSASAGGGYVVRGTVGQADAATPHSGGNFVIGGGFWYGVILAPNLPVLGIELRPSGNIRVFWEDPNDTLVLEESAPPNALELGDFIDRPGPYQADGSTRFIEIANPTGKRFFRLSTPDN